MPKAAHVLRAHFFFILRSIEQRKALRTWRRPSIRCTKRCTNVFSNVSRPQSLVFLLAVSSVVTNKAERLWERKWTRPRIPGLTCQLAR